MKKLFAYSTLAMCLLAQHADDLVIKQPDEATVNDDDLGKSIIDYTVDDLEVVFSFEMMRHSHRPKLNKSPTHSTEIPITEIGKRNAFNKGQ